MEPIKITFLGTGSSVPTKKHNHSSFLITYKDENIMIDCGEGTQRQFRYKDLSMMKLTRLFITHWHGDHILGIPGLLQTLALNNYSKTLHIYGPRNTKHFMSRILETFVFFGKMNYEIHEISPGIVLQNKDFIIEAERLSHGTESFAYSFTEKDKLRLNKSKLKKLKIENTPLLKELQMGKDVKINGKTIKAKQITYLQKGRKITIVLDTKMDERAIKIAKDSDVLICESSHSKDKKEEAAQYNHLTSDQAATIAKKAKVKSLYLTHLSQRYENNPNIILNEAKKIFKNSKLANDLDIVEI